MNMRVVGHRSQKRASDPRELEFGSREHLNSGLHGSAGVLNPEPPLGPPAIFSVIQTM